MYNRIGDLTMLCERRGKIVIYLEPGDSVEESDIDAGKLLEGEEEEEYR